MIVVVTSSPEQLRQNRPPTNLDIQRRTYIKQGKAGNRPKAMYSLRNGPFTQSDPKVEDGRQE